MIGSASDMCMTKIEAYPARAEGLKMRGIDFDRRDVVATIPFGRLRTASIAVEASRRGLK
jgi:hypothetical protein